MWNQNDKIDFENAQKLKKGIVKYNSNIAEVIQDVCSDVRNWTFVEVGAWNGYGSTKIFVEALKNRDESFQFFSLETNSDKQKHVEQMYENEEDVTILNKKLSNPHLKEIEEKYSILKVSKEEQEDLHIDLSNDNASELWSTMPDNLDVVFLDGGKYTSWFDFLIVKERTRYFVLPYSLEGKNKSARDNLLADPEWKEVSNNKKDMNDQVSLFERIGGMGFKKRAPLKKMKIPIVIHHLGGKQEYFQNSIRLNALNNSVIVIGDELNKDASVFQENHKNKVEFVDIQSLMNEDDKISEFRKCFVNYSFQPEEFELQCFLRVFYLLQLMRQRSLRKVFYVDSDCITLCDISKVLSHLPNLSVGISMQKHKQNENKFHMTSCIHNSILTQDMCERFIKLCFQVYGSREKFSLIEAKWKHHEKVMCGGICDMTLWYLYKDHKGDGGESVSDLNEIFEYGGDNCTFDHNVNDPYGVEGNKCYKMSFQQDVNPWAETKKIQKRKGKYYVMTESGKEVRLLTIHYQGGAKEGLAKNVHNFE